MDQSISKAQEQAEARYEIDIRGIIYNSVYAAITSTTGAAVLEAAGVLSGGILVATVLVFLTQIIPKLAKELDKRHSLNEARRNGYMAGKLENSKGMVHTALLKSLSGLGRASGF